MTDEADIDEKELLEASDLDENRTLEKKLLFLRHLAEFCNITRAAKQAGLARSTIYEWKKTDPQFEMDMEQAKEIGFEAMEDEMHRRAFEGTLKITKSGAYKEYSDTLAIFLSKAHKPDKYNERIRNEISGPGGAPLNLDDTKIAMKLDAILKNAMAKKAAAEKPEPTKAADDDFEDLC